MAMNEFSLLELETCVLKVHVNCHGCVRKVKKLLSRMEGVYGVDIDSEQHKVTVTGTVDSATLIKKLGRSGKYAEPWADLNQEQAYYCIKDDKVQNQMPCAIKALKAPRSHPTLGPISGWEAGVETGDERHQNQNMGIEAVTDGLDAEQDSVLGDGDGSGHMTAGDGSTEPTMAFDGFHENGGFVGYGHGGLQNLYEGLQPFEYHHPSHTMMANMPEYQYNHPPPLMTVKNNDMQVMSNINNLTRMYDRMFNPYQPLFFFPSIYY